MRKHQADRAMLMRSGYAAPAAAVLTKPLPMRNAQRQFLLYGNHLIVKNTLLRNFMVGSIILKNTLHTGKKNLFIKGTQQKLMLL